MKKYVHLIPADFDEYNLEDLEKENQRNPETGVCWKNGINDGKYAQKFNVGDSVYIYFHDKRGLTNRILLKAEVFQTDNADDGSEGKNKGKFLYSEYCKEYMKKDDISEENKEQAKIDSESNIKGFYLTNFHAISKKAEDMFKMVYKSQCEKDKQTGILGVKINQTKRILNISNDEKVKKLCELLEQPNLFNRKLSKLIEEYNDHSCYICKNDHSHTFLKPNKLYYFEVHHLLQQSFNTTISKLSANELKMRFPWYQENKYGIGEKNKLIYNNFNEVRLCSKCHNELHYGEFERRRSLLKKLVNNEYKKKLLELVGNEKDRDNIIQYIYQQYGLDYK